MEENGTVVETKSDLEKTTLKSCCLIKSRVRSARHRIRAGRVEMKRRQHIEEIYRCNVSRIQDVAFG